MYGSYCSTLYSRMGSISWENRLLIRVADAVLSNMAEKAKAALVALILNYSTCTNGKVVFHHSSELKQQR